MIPRTPRLPTRSTLLLQFRINKPTPHPTPRSTPNIRLIIHTNTIAIRNRSTATPTLRPPHLLLTLRIIHIQPTIRRITPRTRTTHNKPPTTIKPTR